jgi:hypothetical protein
LGRFIGRDRLGYVDGAGLYGAYFIPNHLDPAGTKTCKPKLISGDGLSNNETDAEFGLLFEDQWALLYWGMGFESKLVVSSMAWGRYRRWGFMSDNKKAKVAWEMEIKCDEDCNASVDNPDQTREKQSFVAAIASPSIELDGDTVTISVTFSAAYNKGGAEITLSGGGASTPVIVGGADVDIGTEAVWKYKCICEDEE